MANMDFKVSSNGLIMFGRGDIELVYDFEQVIQHIKQRLNTFLGEWQYNTLIGIPYYDLFEKPIDIDIFSYWIRKTILETPGVEGLEEFLIDIDEVNRVISINFVCIGSTEGTEVRVTL